MVELRLILVAAALAGAVVAGWSLDQAGFRRGVAITEASYKAAEADALKASQKRLQELSERARAQEQESAKRLSAVSQDFQARLSNAKRENDRMRAALASGDVRLRLPTERSASTDRGASSEARSSSCGRDDGEARELPRAVALALWELAADADAVAEQLAACQRVIRADRG